MIFTLFLLFLTPFSAFASSRDCDGNAVIYCGSLTKSELKTSLNKGTGKQYQSAQELQALFSKYDITIKDIDSDNLKDGRVTKSGKVFVGSKQYASNVKSTGRHKTEHSKQVSGVSYPLYERPTSDSFLSDSIDAFVYVNYDNTMAFAIIKSCGNIVRGVGVKTKPSAETVSIKIQKFEDKNGNKKKDLTESYLAGWNFKVSGPNFNQTVSSDKSGTSTIKGLKPGNYTVTEILQSGWENTTGLSISRQVTTSTSTQTFVFGNKKKISIIPDEPTPPGGETLVESTQLPVSGPAETAAGIAAFVLTGAMLYWFNSKKRLKLSWTRHKK